MIHDFKQFPRNEPVAARDKNEQGRPPSKVRFRTAIHRFRKTFERGSNLDFSPAGPLTASMNMSLANLSVAQLKRAVSIKEQIAKLDHELAKILGDPGVINAPTARKKKRTMSASARARISKAQKARWAKIRATKKK